MDRKGVYSSLTGFPRQAMPGRFRRGLVVAAALITIAFVFVNVSTLSVSTPSASAPTSTNEVYKPALEAHAMSKCPDARDCMRDLVIPAMTQISDKVDFKLSFIGTVDPDSDGVVCKHGPSECLGNELMLCAAQLYPDPKIYLGFSMCMLNQIKKIPNNDLVKVCALEHAVDFDTLNKCVSDEDGTGVGLLRQSVVRSKEAGVIKSCTVRLEGKIRCIRDGGRWKDCEDGYSVEGLVRDVERAYKRGNGLDTARWWGW